MQFWIELLNQLQSAISLAKLVDISKRLILAGAAYLAVMLVWLFVRRIMRSRLGSFGDPTTAAMLQVFAKILFITVGLLIALHVAGLDAGALLASAGVLSLTIGFALKDTLSNIISGFLVFIDRPFTINDLVEIDGQYGRVERITLRTTRIVTKDGRMLAVPNAVVMNKTIASYTNVPNLRIDIKVTIAVTENIDRVRGILVNLVQSDPDYLQEPRPRLVVVEINDYNIAVELQAWLEDERQHMEKRFSLREAVFNALVDAKVEMPLQTIQLAPHKVDLNHIGTPGAMPPELTSNQRND